jgi:hypothetical protein
MPVPFPALRVGEPARHRAVSAFPLFAEPGGTADYRLADDALADGSVAVTEVSEAGSVPRLLVDNQGGRRVLFLEGEELAGAKQNRVLNTSVLIGARSRTPIPVSCVERGRWRFTSAAFSLSGTQAPAELRRALKGSVSRSRAAGAGYVSDQGAVWEHVAGLHAAHGVSSPTEALADGYACYREDLAAFRQAVPYVEGATGMAVAVGPRVLTVDVFDQPATCQKVWGRLLSGVFFEGVRGRDAGPPAAAADVERAVAAAVALDGRPAPAVGEGVEYRAESPGGDHVSALVLDGVVVHGSVVTAG